MSPRLTEYIPHTPTVKQRAFLLLRSREAFFGGAAGGGKSDCLLMAALQYADVPHYAALIIRKSLADANNPGSILFRARQWLQSYIETGRVKWWAEKSMFIFQTQYGAPSYLQFGYLGASVDRYQYDGAEYQFIGFDELTHFYAEDYEYLLTRLRGPDAEALHADPLKKHLAKVPLRLRSASNPGGRGHFFVKERFKIEICPNKTGPTGKPLYAGQDPRRPMVPSFVQDNPFVNQTGVPEGPGAH